MAVEEGETHRQPVELSVVRKWIGRVAFSNTCPAHGPKGRLPGDAGSMPAARADSVLRSRVVEPGLSTQNAPGSLPYPRIFSAVPDRHRMYSPLDP